MSWWGKVAGGAVGFLLGGPLGALLGAALGHKLDTSMGGQGAREYLPALAGAAMAAGVDALFMEVHDDPDHARSDAATQWPLATVESLLTRLLRIREAANG